MSRLLWCLTVTVLPAVISGQSSPASGLKSGREIYRAGCAGCHGPAGQGAPPSTTAFERPRTFPDFTRCDQTTIEDNNVWKNIIRDGGPARGFSPIMPSFSGVLTPEQINLVVVYLRGFCTEKGWPRGELNPPLALNTEKAYPEGEEVIKTSLNAQGGPGVSSVIIHEQRLGKRSQIEVAVPVNFQRPSPGLWYGGFGDVGIGVKRVMFDSLRTGSLFSLFGGVTLPTGSTLRGLGGGTTQFESYAAYTQLLPVKSFLQFQLGGMMPTDTYKVPQSIYFRSVVGKSFNQGHGFGRMWSPMMEFVSNRNIETGASTDWDVVPQMQVTLSKRQHIRFNAGVSVPATNTQGRQIQVMFYVLWDWLDGRLLEGWR